ncbi:MAG: aminoacyl-tRNA hydrolase [Coprothermobacterota bacterium]|nr:aminoacyl-tRNA hydrolase [Coprothermobacterota bacterium]
MKLVAGLGNPGKIYERTRHNIGFRILRAYAKKHGLQPWHKKGKARFIKFDDLILLLPQTFMNLSGLAVSNFARQYKLSPEDILVVHDDVDIEFGEIRFKEGGSSAGHKGLASIIAELQSESFSRLRFGIGKNPDLPTEDYVLQNFSREEEQKLPLLLEHAVSGIELWLDNGIEACMNFFNRKNLLSA